jgi:hypothetical protein
MECKSSSERSCANCSYYFGRADGGADFAAFGHCSRFFVLGCKADGGTEVVGQILDQSLLEVPAFCVPQPRPDFLCEFWEDRGSDPPRSLGHFSCSTCEHWQPDEVPSGDRVDHLGRPGWGRCRATLRRCGPPDGEVAGSGAYFEIETEAPTHGAIFCTLRTPRSHYCTSHSFIHLPETTVQAAEYPLPVTANAHERFRKKDGT